MGGVSQKGLIASVKSERNNKKGFYTLCNYLFFGLDKRLEMRKECSLWRAHWPTNELKGVGVTVQVILFEMDCAIFYTNLYEWLCQFISWTNLVNSGKFMDTCWISCQVMADMKIFYDNLIIVNLYCNAFWSAVTIIVFFSIKFTDQ